MRKSSILFAIIMHYPIKTQRRYSCIRPLRLLRGDAVHPDIYTLAHFNSEVIIFYHILS